MKTFLFENYKTKYDNEKFEEEYKFLVKNTKKNI